jgi:hypothetical protein
LAVIFDFGHKLRLMAFAGRERLGQFGPIGSLARLNLGKLSAQLPAATVEIVGNRLALGRDSAPAAGSWTSPTRTTSTCAPSRRGRLCRRRPDAYI